MHHSNEIMCRANKQSNGTLQINVKKKKRTKEQDVAQTNQNSEE